MRVDRRVTGALTAHLLSTYLLQETLCYWSISFSRHSIY